MAGLYQRVCEEIEAVLWEHKQEDYFEGKARKVRLD